MTGPGENAAAGWRGDRYLCYEGGKGFVWKTVWASEADAAEFLAAEQKVLGARSDRAARLVELKQQGASVLLIDGVDEAWAKALGEKFAR
jgi:hypothetical protein